MENKVGTKIKEARRMKGYSQEELAESSGVSLRTIQRVENNQSEPRGKTLQLLCESMEINMEDILDYGKKSATNYIVFFHLSVISFILFPLGNIILPLILWLTKKDRIIGLNKIGVNVLNFQIIWSVLTYGSAGVFAFYKIQNYYITPYLWYFYIGLMILNIILPVYFSIASKLGHTEKYYPLPFRIIK